MGFMDKFKDAAKQASAGLGAVTPNAGDMEYAQLANKLQQSGIDCVATIESIAETGSRDPGGKQFSIAVNVEGNGEPYDATVMQYLADASVASFQPGKRFTAKADPADPARLILYGPAA
jgi:hypothetical protein